MWQRERDLEEYIYILYSLHYLFKTLSFSDNFCWFAYMRSSYAFTPAASMIHHKDMLSPASRHSIFVFVFLSHVTVFAHGVCVF